MTKQKRHTRISKKGKPFTAGSKLKPVDINTAAVIELHNRGLLRITDKEPLKWRITNKGVTEKHKIMTLLASKDSIERRKIMTLLASKDSIERSKIIALIASRE